MPEIIYNYSDLHARLVNGFREPEKESEPMFYSHHETMWVPASHASPSVVNDLYRQALTDMRANDLRNLAGMCQQAQNMSSQAGLQSLCGGGQALGGLNNYSSLNAMNRG